MLWCDRGPGRFPARSSLACSRLVLGSFLLLFILHLCIFSGCLLRLLLLLFGLGFSFGVLLGGTSTLILLLLLFLRCGGLSVENGGDLGLEDVLLLLNVR